MSTSLSCSGILPHIHPLYMILFCSEGRLPQPINTPASEIALCSSPPCGRGNGDDAQYKETCDTTGPALWAAWLLSAQLPHCNKPCQHCVCSTESKVSSAWFHSHWKRHCWEEMSTFFKMLPYPSMDVLQRLGEVTQIQCILSP